MLSSLSQQRELFLSSRDRHPPNEVVGYIENNVSLPGQPRPLFSERSCGFVTLDEANQLREQSAAMWAEVNAEKEHLFALMEQVQRKLCSEKGDGDQPEEVNLRQCSWKAVMNEVQSTARRWKSRPSKQGKTMVFIDKVGQHSAALEAWLGLLPGGDYGSSICGVFKLAIGAASQYHKVEEAIFEALSELPRIMESARRYVEMYHEMRDQFSEQRTIELFQAVLRLLRHVMQFFADGASKNVFGSILKQDSYKTELLQCVKDIRARAEVVNEEAVQCQGRLLCRVYDQNQETHQFFHQLMVFLQANPRFEARNSEFNHRENEASRLQPSSYDIVNIDPMTPSEENEDTRSCKMPESPVQKYENMTTHDEETEAAISRLLHIFHHDTDEPLRDISSTLRLDCQLSETTKARAAAMIRDNSFRSFIQETKCSTRLLVNGWGDLSASDGVSPLSIVVAELALQAGEAAERVPVFTIHYFCAEHSAPPPSDFPTVQDLGAIRMMTSLTSQLVCLLKDRGVDADVSFLTDSEWHKLERLRPKSLFAVFRKLIRQMPLGSILLCIIDEISLYETSLQGESTNMIMEKLVRLTNNAKDGGNPVFKLLVTCHGCALDVSRHFSGHTLDLQEEIEADDASDWIISTLV